MYLLNFIFHIKNLEIPKKVKKSETQILLLVYWALIILFIFLIIICLIIYINYLIID